MGLKQVINDNVRNIPGWRTKKRIIVFESDDWGSIRMPSKQAFNRLKSLGVNLDSMDYLRYNLYDTLANQDDFEFLYDILSKTRDRNNNTCVFTAVSVVANPDFNKIKESNFQHYFYEPFTNTLQRYYGNNKIITLWHEGIEKQLFVPQFHGREHLNVSAWMKSLRKGQRSAILAFNEGMWGFAPDNESGYGIENQAAFELSDPNDIEEHKEIINDGLQLFYSIFGYRARYFVPPNGPVNNSLNQVLKEKGIDFRSTAKLQNESTGYQKTKKVIHWLGQRDKYGIRYITRNCFFEPSITKKDWIDSCLNDINNAFRWHKPAIISSHRVNYIGVHEPSNRDNTLRGLKNLLAKILKIWPDVEFMTTPQLGDLICKKHH